MQLLRIFFSKTGEAAYISHLDLQRVMARALRISGLPVWYSQGFNPHIYMTFALPLPLMHESLAECVDCKTESEETDFSAYVQPLSDALPRGIAVSRIAQPMHGADAIATAQYQMRYPDGAALEKAVGAYNAAGAVMVVRKTKRTEAEVDLKAVLPALAPVQDGAVTFQLPAGSTGHYSPALLAQYFQNACSLPAEDAAILRQAVFTAEGEPFR